MMMNNGRFLGIKIFGIMNVVFGSLFLIAYSLPFLMAVGLGWVTDMKIHGSLHWFLTYIIDRASIAISFVFLFYLFKSGLFLLRQDTRARKLAIVACSAIVFNEALGFLSAFIQVITYGQISFDFLNPWAIASNLFSLYYIFQIIYFLNPKLKNMFSDKEVKISLIKPTIIIIILLFSPLFVVPILSFILGKIRQPL